MRIVKGKAQFQIIDLPHPLSVNAMFRSPTAQERARGVRNRPHSKAYATWARSAGWMIRAAKPKQVRGDCELILTICESYKGDLDNTFKAVLDIFEKCGVVLNDKQFRKLTVQFGPVEGMRAEIRPLAAEGIGAKARAA